MRTDKTRIHMIDNDSILCENVERYFQENRPDLILEATAQSGLAGLQNIARMQPSCIIMDLMLPDLDGIAVLQKIADLGLSQKPRVLILSSFSSEAAINSVSRLGVDFFMLKPCDFCALADRVQQMGLVPRRSPSMLATACINPESRISEELQRAGIPVHVQGYRYLRTAVEVVIDEEKIIDHVTKILYPTVAELNNTTSSRVERAMRHAIAMAWREDSIEKSSQYLHHLGLRRRSKPTNSEFIALIAGKVRLEMCAGL